MLVALLICVIAAGGIWFLIARREEFMREERRNRAAALRLERRVQSRTAELRRANAHLEREVGERQQAEENLRQTQAELVQAAKLATLGRMRQAGYTKEFAAGVIANAGTLGILIPPSIVMVVYAAATNVSVGRMFFAGVIPGIIAGLMLMA